MPLTKPIGFLCYNNSELVRDGYIESVEAFEHDADDFNFNLLKRNRKGITYQLIREDLSDPDKITKVIERRKLLPAEKIKIEIQFSKTLKNAVTHPITPGSIPGAAEFFLGNSFSGIGFGGITSGFTDFVYDIIDSEMSINERINITQEILDTGIIKFESFPVSIFGIVKEHKEELVDADAEKEFKEAHPQARIETDSESGLRVGKVGLDFTGDQTERIGQNSRGSYQGGPRKRIDGATNSKGQFGEIGNPFIKIVDFQGDSDSPPEQEVVLLRGQDNIFLEIIRDHRKLKFRGDNRDVSGLRSYPFKNREVDDITDHNIRINTDDLKIDDTIYITFCVSRKRRVRQAMRHKGIVGQGNTFGVTGWNLEIGSEMDVFDYQIKEWIVPNVTPEQTAPDNEFKITFNQYKQWKDQESEFDESISSASSTKAREALVLEKQSYFDERFDNLEGWRMSSVITSRLDVMWAADYRGIVLMGDKFPAVVVFPASDIDDQDWFLDYVKGLDFIEKHIDPVTGDTIYDNLEIKIDSVHSKLNNMVEGPIDIGNPTNELLFDSQKIPYFKDFAKALQTVSLFDISDSNSGIGIPSLDILLKDLLDNGDIAGVNTEDFYKNEKVSYLSEIETAFNNATWLISDLKYYDLSLSSFLWSLKQPIATWDCSDDFPIKENHYTCHTYDPGDGPGIWLSTSYIENSVFEWRPPGGFIESYWKMDTPYFCGEFGRKTRIYIEKVGGNSLDNFSWIYVDTWPDVPETISLDKNIFIEKSYLSFYDNDYLDSASFHTFTDAAVESSFKFLNINIDKKQSRDFLNSNDDEDAMIEIHKAQRIIGYNNILGDIPSYTKGKVITNDTSHICHNNLENFWEQVDFLNGTTPGGESFDVDFTEDIPRIKNIPFDWAIKEIQVNFSLPLGETITTDEAYSTLYFEDVDESINNFLLTPSGGLTRSLLQDFKLNIDCSYYNSETIQLLGESWKKLNIKSLKGVVSSTFNLNDIKIKEGQTSIIDDGLGRILVFFSDSLSGNISVALTFNEGATWVIYRDIIRLVADEIATLPVAYQDSITSTIHLFYVLNDSFLMYTIIDADKLDCEDIWINYEPPDFYDETSNDDDDTNSLSSLSPFTENGKSLRRTISYFVAGSSEDSFFIEQINITNNIKKNNLTSETPQHFRFDYTGNLDDLDDSYNGKPFAIHKDNKGILRIFYADEDGMTIKASNNYQRWEYVSKNLPLHKTYLTDDIKEDSDPIVSNIQVARNYYDEEIIYLFYFFRGMLLMRVLPINLLTVKIDKDGNIDDSQMRNFLQIKPEFYGHRPIFISGYIPDDILKVRVRELEEEKITGEEVISDISILFPYGLEDIGKFDINFEIDSSTQVFAYTTATGTVRVFYKDAFGNLNGAYINGESTTPEIFYEVRQELIK